jgi:hypothetical protein
MAGVEIIHEVPARDSLIELKDFQAETPITFFDTKPVLHFRSSATIIISKTDLEENEVIQKLVKESAIESNTEGSDETVIPDVEVLALST